MNTRPAHAPSSPAPSRRHLAAGLLGALTLPALSTRARASGRFADAAAYSAERSGVSLLIQQGGQQVLEDYPGAGAAGAAWELASGTKSFSGILAALLMDSRRLGLDELCADTLTEWRADPIRRTIRVRELLSLTSGIAGGPIGQVPTYAEAVAAPAVARPGTAFSYGPVPFQIFGELVRRKLAAARQDPDPVRFLQTRLFDPLGIRPGRWRRGADGNPHLPSGAALTAQDWLRFGAMVLGGGLAPAGSATPGRRLISRSALEACFVTTRTNPGYGLTWWVPAADMVGPGQRARRRAAQMEDLSGVAQLGQVWMAAGAGNQRLYILPERQLVIVRQATGIARALRGAGDPWSDSAFLRLVLQDT